MITKEKRAVSALVATVLLILITVAAVGIIWGAIMPMMNRAMEMGQACLNARLTINTEAGYTCYVMNTSDQYVQVMVGRGSEEFELSGVHLIVSGSGESKTFAVTEGETTAGVTMIDGTPTLELPNTNEERTYIIDVSTFTTAEEVKVAPIAKVGNTDKTCDISSRVTLSVCG